MSAPFATCVSWELSASHNKMHPFTIARNSSIPRGRNVVVLSKPLFFV